MAHLFPILHTAFSLVEPDGNWKLAIDKTLRLDAEDVAVIRRAVIHFTASVPTIEVTDATPDNIGRMLYRVTAAGYYAACGA